jgi:hypothetical protein
MKKTKAQQDEKAKQNKEQKLKEQSLIKDMIVKTFSSAEEINVDTEFKTVEFYVSNTEMNAKRNQYEIDGTKFTFEKMDKDVISLTYGYKQK